MPVSTCAHGILCAEQEKLLSGKDKKLSEYPALLRAKGNGAIKRDLEGIHWVPDEKNPTPLTLQIALMDGESLLAHREFVFGKRTTIRS